MCFNSRRFKKGSLIMLTDVHYFDLGATLYLPSTHKDLLKTFQNGVNHSRSVVACLEDSIKEKEIPKALKKIKQMLIHLKPTPKMKRFIRPSNSVVLSELLTYQNIEKIDGFVLPKFDLHTFNAYDDVLKDHKRAFSLMPTLETAHVFDTLIMNELAQLLLNWDQKIVCLRIGGNDLMNLLGLKRMKGMTIYDTPLRGVIEQLMIQFRTKGFELSAPVFDYIRDVNTLHKELMIDLSYGFYAKTAIHPYQIPIIEEAFLNFSKQHKNQATLVLNETSSAVFQFCDQMMETKCHHSWANRTLRFSKNYI
jgi:citrate lyase beta subunit